MRRTRLSEVQWLVQKSFGSDAVKPQIQHCLKSSRAFHEQPCYTSLTECHVYLYAHPSHQGMTT